MNKLCKQIQQLIKYYVQKRGSKFNIILKYFLLQYSVENIIKNNKSILNKLKNNNTKMKKVLAILAVNPQYVQFAVPQLKSLLSKLKIPFNTLFSQSLPLPQKYYQINHKNIKNFPYVTLTVPDFDKYRDYFQLASKKAVMVSKFVLLVAEGKNYQQLSQNKDQQILNTQCRDWNQHVVCDFISRNRVIDRKQQTSKIHNVFQKLDIRGKVDIKNATKRLQIIQQHKWYQNHHQVSSDQTLQKVYFGIQLSSCKIKTAKFNIKYQLGNRIYLGPTSTDNDLAFLMCNQANLQDGSIVLDPFVGTAGLLIPPASHGAIVFGCDLDMRVLNGYAVGRINKKSNYYSAEKKLQTFTPKIYLNFDQYQLPRPNILRMDCTKSVFAPHTQFDAIITDPPYGIRAMSRTTTKKQQNKIQMVETHKLSQQEQQIIEAKQQQETKQIQKQQQVVQKTEEQIKIQEKKKQKKQKKKQTRKKRLQMMTEQQKSFKSAITQKLNRQRIDNWGKFDKGVIADTERQIIFEGLLHLARKYLKKGGRLVFLYPVYEDQQFIGIDTLPNHEGFQVIDMSQNILSRNNSRILVTLQKL